MKSAEIRSLFLRFFEEKGHTVLPSSSLVPLGDPTLLLTSAGMVQIKPYFMGEATPPNPRLASCQKCFRTTDISAVGDAKHLTFFEMLGNFSVGDYFKREAIAWAWEFVTQRLHLPPERLWITVFLDDDEAFDYWLALGIPRGRIVRCGEKDNFWGPAGETGPCGPCSEIHYDLGEEVGCGRPGCGPACGCARFSEIWNLVFTQYNQDAQGNRIPLPRPNIDTGMGLERTAAIMQGKSSVYETDLFAPLISSITGVSGRRYGEDEATSRAMRIAAEHGRAITFLIADGVIPSNEGRGYVLRRVLRRAVLYGRKLGLAQPFLTEVAGVVVDNMGAIYPELAESRSQILKVVATEEKRFGATLGAGLERLEGMFDFRGLVAGQLAGIGSAEDVPDLRMWLGRVFDDNAGRLEDMPAPKREAWTYAFGILGDAIRNDREASGNSAGVAIRSENPSPPATENGLAAIARMAHEISGSEAFRLYDTYGFPVEMTREFAAERGFSVDLDGFGREMDAQRERAREAQKFGLADTSSRRFYEALGLPDTDFVGYEHLSRETRVLGLVVEDTLVQTALEGQEVGVVVAETPFYAEMGGQVGDTGMVLGPKGRVSIGDTTRPTGALVVHVGRVAEGAISVGDQVQAVVDSARRLDIARNHTATHLLQKALRQVLGDQVRQSGSLVAPDHFRFDFTHLVAPTGEEMAEVVRLVNDSVRRNLAVSARVVSHRQATELGALAFFGEKYGDEVRLVEICSADPSETVSAELCGGTHVRATGEIGFFQVVGERSIGSGIRRIEAVTGRGAEDFARERLATLDAVSSQLDGSGMDIREKVAALLSELNEERRRARELESQLMVTTAESLLPRVQQLDGINVLAARVSASGMEALREMGDWLKERLGSAVIVLGVVLEDNPRFLAMVTPDLVGRGFHAGNIARRVAQVAGGGGGGKSEIGQSGGKDKGKLDEALGLVPSLIGKGYHAHSGS